MSLFYTDLDRAHVEVRTIHKMGRHAVDSNMLFIDGLKVPETDRIGPEGQGFKMILHGLNPERILIAAEAVGIGCAAPRATPTSAWSSTARSAKTRASNIRSRNVGRRSRPPISW